MPHKTITISEEAYQLLASLKVEGESFTEVIVRTARKLKEQPLSSFAGRWTGNPEELEEVMMDVGGMWRTYDQDLELGR